MGWLLLLGWPVAEVAFGVWVADRIGAGATVLILLASMAVGSILLRSVTARGLARVRVAAAAGRVPGREAGDAISGFAGALLVTLPGLLSTGVGLLLLFPPLRPLARRVERRLFARRFAGLGWWSWRWGRPGGPGPVIEGELADEAPAPGSPELDPHPPEGGGG